MPRTSAHPKVESFNFRVDPELKAAFAAAAAQLAAGPDSDEAEVMRWMENVSDTEGWTA